MFWVPQDHPHIQRLVRKTLHIVVLLARIYDSHVVRIYSQIIKEKSTGGAWRNLYADFLARSLPPGRSHTGLILSPAVKM